MANVTDQGNQHLCLAWQLPHDVALAKSSNWWNSCSLECLNLKITAKILRKCSVTINFGNVITAFARFNHSKEDGPNQYEDSPHETAWRGSLAKHRCWFHMLFSSVGDIGQMSVFLKNYSISCSRYLEAPPSHTRWAMLVLMATSGAIIKTMI